MLPKDGILVINKDDMNCMDVVNELSEELSKKQVRIYTFSIGDPTATIYAKIYLVILRDFIHLKYLTKRQMIHINSI